MISQFHSDNSRVNIHIWLSEGGSMSTIRFNKRAGKTICKGQITVPREFSTRLDCNVDCPVGKSIDISYVLADKHEMRGRLYQSVNNSTNYYQFYLVEPNDRELFASQCKILTDIDFEFNTTERRLFLRTWLRELLSIPTNFVNGMLLYPGGVHLFDYLIVSICFDTMGSP